MKIDLYSLCWNEMRVLPYFIRHYEPWVQRIIIFDDGSQDGSVDYLRSFGKVEVREKPSAFEDSMVDSNRSVYNNCWKESRGRADWVIVTNIDEHLYHASLPGYLNECQSQGVTLVPALGCDMVTRDFPPPDVSLPEVVTRGFSSSIFSKLSLFNPNAIVETNFGVGRHIARPKGEIKYPDRDEVLNLHFKNLGLDYLLARLPELGTGLRARDVEKGWGFNYLSESQEIAERFEEYASRSRPIDLNDPSSVANELEELWWHKGADNSPPIR